MKKPTLGQIARYKFDNFMAGGGRSMFIILTVLFLAGFVLIGGLRVLIEAGGADSERGGGITRQLYLTWLQMTDPGNMAQDIESSPWLKVTTVLAGIAGIILLSMLIGFITTVLVDKMEQLRKGRSRVIEDDHSLILGWNPQRVVEILRELVMANESEDNPCVVILADRDKEMMDDYLALALPVSERQNTRIVTRSGSTSNVLNLRIAAVEACRSVIVLAGFTDTATRAQKTESDAKVIKTILALAATRAEDNPLNIVAELYDPLRHAIVQGSCPHPITTADADESALAKIIVQTSRSEGLSVAYSELLSFDGCEMYFYGEDWPEIPFGQLQFHFPDGVPLGIRSADGEILINPPIDRIMQGGDEILIVAEDDSTIEFKSKPVAVPEDYSLQSGRIPQRKENELIIGWNRKGRIIIEEYADYVSPGSRVDVMVTEASADLKALINQLNTDLENLTVGLIEADPLETGALETAGPSSRDNIIILSGGEDPDIEYSPERCDAETILILLLLRKIFEENPDDSVETRLITEVMDSSNQDLITRAGVKDIIISNRLISMMLAQISEEADIKAVYDDLFSEDGSEIYFKPAEIYFGEIPESVSFADCMRIAQKREEVCIGIKIKADELNADENFGVQLIPEKNTRFNLKPEDRLIVVSEDET